jgi:hypothetical protein
MVILSKSNLWAFIGSLALEKVISQAKKEWSKEKIEETLRSVGQSFRSHPLSQEAIHKLYQGRDKIDDVLRAVNEKGHEHGQSLYSRMH